MQCAPPSQGLPSLCLQQTTSPRTVQQLPCQPFWGEVPQATATFWSGSGVSSAPPEQLPSAAEGCLTLQLGHNSLSQLLEVTCGARAAEGQTYCLCSWAAPAGLPHILPCLLPVYIGVVCVGHSVHVFFLLPPSFLYFVSPLKHCITRSVRKGKKSQPAQVSREIQAEFRNRLRMNEKCPHLLLIPTNPFLSCRQGWAAPCTPVPCWQSVPTVPSRAVCSLTALPPRRAPPR